MIASAATQTCPCCGSTIFNERRFFYPARIESRGKTSLPFTTREPDFVPDENTIRRKNDAFERNMAKFKRVRRAAERKPPR